MSNIILSMFEIADVLECRHFEISIDDNQYKTRTVLNERLTKLQGPSLLFRFDKALPIEQILKLQQIWAWNSKSPVPAISKEKSLHFQQSGILPLYYLTDCLQIITGDKYVVLDPADQYLQDLKQQNKPNLVQQFITNACKYIHNNSQSKNNKTKKDNKDNDVKKETPGKELNITFEHVDKCLTDEAKDELLTTIGSARIFRYINNNNNTGLIKQFPDQFMPFIPFTLKDNTPFPGTFIRVPL
eukprot:111219_1